MISRTIQRTVWHLAETRLGYLLSLVTLVLAVTDAGIFAVRLNSDVWTLITIALAFIVTPLAWSLAQARGAFLIYCEIVRRRSR